MFDSPIKRHMTYTLKIPLYLKYLIISGSSVKLFPPLILIFRCQTHNYIIRESQNLSLFLYM